MCQRLIVLYARKSVERENSISCETQLEAQQNTVDPAGKAIDLAQAWQQADYDCKKAVAMVLIHQMRIAPDGSVTVVWNL